MRRRVERATDAFRASTIFFWSICMICMASLLSAHPLLTRAQGLVTNFGGLAATRILLGLFEAPLFPALNYLLVRG